VTKSFIKNKDSCFRGIT